MENVVEMTYMWKKLRQSWQQAPKGDCLLEADFRGL